MKPRARPAGDAVGTAREAGSTTRSKPTRPLSRFAARAFAALAVGLLAFLILLSRSPPTPTALAVPSTNVPVRVVHRRVIGPAPAPVVNRPSTPLAAQEPVAAEQLHQLLETPEGTRMRLAEYKQLSRLSPTTLTLRADMVDALDPHMFHASPMGVTPRNAHDEAAMADPETFLRQTFVSSRYRYLPGEPIEVALTIERGQTTPVPVDAELSSPAAVSTIGADGAKTMVGTIDLARKSTGVYGGAFDADILDEQAFTGSVEVSVQWIHRETPQVFPLIEAALVVHHTAAPPARFTGLFRDEVKDGSLLIRVGVECKRPGKFVIDGRLFAADGTTPIAMVTAVGNLSHEGRILVPMVFYGLALRESGHDGPYVLKGVYGHLEDVSNGERGPEMEPFLEAYTTRPYPRDAFTDKEWNSAQKDLIVKTYEDEIRRLEAKASGK